MTEGLSVIEISLVVRLSIMMVSPITVKLSGQEYFGSIARDQIVPLIVRAVCGTLAFVTISLSLKWIPLSIYFVVENFLPFLAALLAFIFLGERIMFFEFFAMCMCFCGILTVCFYAQEDPSEQEELSHKSGQESTGLFSTYTFGVLMALATTFFQAISVIMTRRLKSLHFTVIQFHYASISTLCFGVWTLYLVYFTDRKLFQFYNEPTVWLKLLGACACNFTGQNLVTVMN